MDEEVRKTQPEPELDAYFLQLCEKVGGEMPVCPGCITFCPKFLDQARLALGLSTDEISDEDLVVRVRESLALVDKINRGELYSEEELMALKQWGVID